MNKLACVILFAIASVLQAGERKPNVVITAADALIQRLIPGRAGNFITETIPADNGRDVFEIESRDGKIILRGNSPLSQAVALNWYLKYYAHCHVSLNGRQLNLPTELPTVNDKVRIVGWAQYRYFLNYVTYGYQIPWWNWEQWERFIDWMALNGINQPLAITGQEAVWQAVGKRFGMTDAEIEAFLPGTPYLPFCWMGCLDSHGGPLPKNWIPQHVDLQKKILARQRELGMTPVLQGFTGHLPEVIVKKFPGTKAQKIHWFGFNSWMLDPTDPLFRKLSDAWMEEQTKLFGTDHLYAADSFIEMTPPNGDLKYMANIGREIYQGMARTDPKAVWLFQSWAFYCHTLWGKPLFWTPPRMKAFLNQVPNEHMQILDLYCEAKPFWKISEGFHGKPWVYNHVYNFGNNSTLGSSGPLARFNDIAQVRKDPHGKNLRGVGLMMEGFSHNPLIFDIMFEMAWRDDIELQSWVRDFTRFRYGQTNVDAQAAWETLRTKIYDHKLPICGGKVAFEAVPDKCSYSKYPTPSLFKAWRQLLAAAHDLGNTDTYRHDLVNIARQALASHSNELYEKTMAAYRAKNQTAFAKTSGEFLQLIHDLDELLATNGEFLLGKWLEDAKRWGETDAERARLEWNARRIITLWGTGENVNNYASKHWAGLLDGFYAKRWAIFFSHLQSSLQTGKPVNVHAAIYKFEEEWCNTHETYAAKPIGDSVAVARRLYQKYAPQTIANLALDKPVTCSLALPGMEACNANDGIIDSASFWGTDIAKDSAAWWQVDFEKPTTVGRVVIVSYFGDKRVYGFTLEGSLDGKTWTRLADHRVNKEPSTQSGYTCSFTPQEIRYLRVTMTSNSANSGRHLVEVMAFEQ